LEKLSAEQQATLDAQLAKIRNEILTRGESVASCETLLVLCGGVPAGGQWNAIATIAKNEQWSFEFHPNGDIRLAPL